MKFRQSAIVFPGAIVLSIIFVFAFIASTFTTPVSVSAQKAVKSDSGEGQDVVMQLAAPAATFPGSGFGAIPDNLPGTPLNVTFNVTGITGAPTNVEVSHTYSPIHTWAGDINCTLIAPNGTSFVIYGRTGQTGASAGDSSDLSGPYNFKDTAAGTNWWAAANTAGAAAVIPPGDYRTTQTGPQPVITTSPVTNLTAAFAGVANANGTWTLRFTDNASGDTGSVSAATLTITGAPVVLTKPNADFSGDGKTDYSQIRDVTPMLQGGSEFYRLESVREKLKYLADNPPADSENLVPGTSLRWFVNNSASQANNAIVDFGEATTDFVVPSDYDGDGKADIAVWRPGAPTVAAFYIFQSFTSTVRMELFGQTGDDPAITGDYDGDAKSDVAVQRCPPIGSPGQCFFFYRGSNANPMGNVTYVPWGFGQQFDVFANPGDFDGDGKFDFCLQRTAPSGSPAGQFVLLRSLDGGREFITWGLNSDVIVPGDYDGDGKYDFMVSRTETISGVSGRSYYLLERDGGGTGANPIRWGSAGDIRAPGDYDGDGKTDVAIWRPSVTPSTSTYWVRRSSDGALQTFGYGNQGDGVVPSWNVH